jgi:hypothetical protein
MGRRKIKVRKYYASKRPNLRFVVNYREVGKRKRSFFETKEQAESFAAFKNGELRRNGIEHAEFPTALRVMAQNAVEQLKPFGKTITDAVQHYVAHLKASEKSCTAVQLVKELVAAKQNDGVSKRHLDDLRSRLNIFAEKFDGQPVATITSAEIDDWLRSLRRRKFRKICKIQSGDGLTTDAVSVAPREAAKRLPSGCRKWSKTGGNEGLSNISPTKFQLDQYWMKSVHPTFSLSKTCKSCKSASKRGLLQVLIMRCSIQTHMPPPSGI